MAVLQQEIDDVAPDESRTAGYEGFHAPLLFNDGR
jgi:hypothetical protein